MFPHCVRTMHILPNLVTYWEEEDKNGTGHGYCHHRYYIGRVYIHQPTGGNISHGMAIATGVVVLSGSSHQWYKCCPNYWTLARKVKNCDA